MRACVFAIVGEHMRDDTRAHYLFIKNVAYYLRCCCGETAADAAAAAKEAAVAAAVGRLDAIWCDVDDTCWMPNTNNRCANATICTRCVLWLFLFTLSLFPYWARVHKLTHTGLVSYARTTQV